MPRKSTITSTIDRAAQHQEEFFFTDCSVLSELPWRRFAMWKVWDHKYWKKVGNWWAQMVLVQLHTDWSGWGTDWSGKTGENWAIVDWWGPIDPDDSDDPDGKGNGKGHDKGAGKGKGDGKGQTKGDGKDAAKGDGKDAANGKGDGKGHGKDAGNGDGKGKVKAAPNTPSPTPAPNAPDPVGPMCLCRCICGAYPNQALSPTPLPEILRRVYRDANLLPPNAAPTTPLGPTSNVNLDDVELSSEERTFLALMEGERLDRRSRQLDRGATPEVPRGYIPMSVRSAMESIHGITHIEAMPTTMPPPSQSAKRRRMSMG